MSNHQPEPKSWLEKLSLGLLGEPRDRDDLMEILRDAQRRNLLNSDALEMIEGVLHFSELQARDIMVPRSRMSIVKHDGTLQEILEIALQTGHSRLPIIAEDRDHVTGILLVKDLLVHLRDPNQVFDLNVLSKEAHFIPESKRLHVLLREFRQEKMHIAIVVDEYGGIAGMVTIEDVLEEIVGDIDDEHDREHDQPLITAITGRRFMVQAITSIEDFNERFNTSFSDEKADTIGGLMITEMGHLPKTGDSMVMDNLQFIVREADKRRVHRLEVHLPTPTAIDTDETADKP